MQCMSRLFSPSLENKVFTGEDFLFSSRDINFSIFSVLSKALGARQVEEPETHAFVSIIQANVFPDSEGFQGCLHNSRGRLLRELGHTLTGVFMSWWFYLASFQECVQF